MRYCCHFFLVESVIRYACHRVAHESDGSCEGMDEQKARDANAVRVYRLTPDPMESPTDFAERLESVKSKLMNCRLADLLDGTVESKDQKLRRAEAG